MQELEKVLQVANSEVGYLEKKSNANLDDKTANAGDKNYTKYARDMDNLNVYNGKKQGYAWCNVFIDWCFVQAVGVDRARELLIGFSAGCTQDYNWFKERGQIVTSPQRGDLVFFGNTSHIGIIEKVENGKIYTIEGNTSNKAELVTNGGAVAKKSYAINSKYIHSFARPNYINTPDLQYKAHIQDIGWTDWTNAGEIVGTEGQEKRIEAIIIQANNGVDIQYKVHMEGIGWSDWKRNGEVAGTEGESRRIEAIEIQCNKSLEAREQVQDIGWMPFSRGTGIKIGTETKGLRLEAFVISVV